jgi:CHAT domain-containing protein
MSIWYISLLILPVLVLIWRKIVFLVLAIRFYAAGAKNVLYTLWGIPDDLATKFANMFYGKLQAGQTILKAFEKSQIYISAKYPPAFWAAFRLIE